MSKTTNRVDFLPKKWRLLTVFGASLGLACTITQPALAELFKAPNPKPPASHSPSSKTSAPEGGFVPTIRRLMAESKRCADRREFTKAIQLADRAQKISEAAAQLLGPNSDCSPEQTAKFSAEIRAREEAYEHRGLQTPSTQFARSAVLQGPGDPIPWRTVQTAPRSNETDPPPVAPRRTATSAAAKSPAPLNASTQPGHVRGQAAHKAVATTAAVTVPPTPPSIPQAAKVPAAPQSAGVQGANAEELLERARQAARTGQTEKAILLAELVQVSPPSMAVFGPPKPSKSSAEAAELLAELRQRYAREASQPEQQPQSAIVATVSKSEVPRQQPAARRAPTSRNVDVASAVKEEAARKESGTVRRQAEAVEYAIPMSAATIIASDPVPPSLPPLPDDTQAPVSQNNPIPVRERILTSNPITSIDTTDEFDPIASSNWISSIDAPQPANEAIQSINLWTEKHFPPAPTSEVGPTRNRVQFSRSSFEDQEPSLEMTSDESEVTLPEHRSSDDQPPPAGSSLAASPQDFLPEQPIENRSHEIAAENESSSVMTESSEPADLTSIGQVDESELPSLPSDPALPPEPLSSNGFSTAEPEVPVREEPSASEIGVRSQELNEPSVEAKEAAEAPAPESAHNFMKQPSTSTTSEQRPPLRLRSTPTSLSEIDASFENEIQPESQKSPEQETEPQVAQNAPSRPSIRLRSRASVNQTASTFEDELPATASPVPQQQSEPALATCEPAKPAIRLRSRVTQAVNNTEEKSSVVQPAAGWESIPSKSAAEPTFESPITSESKKATADPGNADSSEGVVQRFPVQRVIQLRNRLESAAALNPGAMAKPGTPTQQNESQPSEKAIPSGQERRPAETNADEFRPLSGSKATTTNSEAPAPTRVRLRTRFIPNADEAGMSNSASSPVPKPYVERPRQPIVGQSEVILWKSASDTKPTEKTRPVPSKPIVQVKHSLKSDFEPLKEDHASKPEEVSQEPTPEVAQIGFEAISDKPPAEQKVAEFTGKQSSGVDQVKDEWYASDRTNGSTIAPLVPEEAREDDSTLQGDPTSADVVVHKSSFTLIDQIARFFHLPVATTVSLVAGIGMALFGGGLVLLRAALRVRHKS